MNKYEVISSVGEGAYGVVLKCRNRETGELVAVKKFKETEDDEAVRKTTLREVKILRMLSHPNIVLLKEAFRRRGKLYLVFEFVDKNLLEFLEMHPAGLEPELVRYLSFQTVRAIDYLHSNNVFHRDLKLENLLINISDKSLKLCDFGFAKTLSSAADVHTSYCATRWYRAPELLLEAKYSKEVDIWAIGCITAELVDAQPLFPGESEIDQLFLIQKMLGPLTPDQQDQFLRNPRFAGLKFPDMTKPETLEKRFLGKVSKRAMNFMKNMLNLDPKLRLTAHQALNHPWFDDLLLAAAGVAGPAGTAVASAGSTGAAVGQTPTSLAPASRGLAGAGLPPAAAAPRLGGGGGGVLSLSRGGGVVRGAPLGSVVSAAMEDGSSDGETTSTVQGGRLPGPSSIPSLKAHPGSRAASRQSTQQTDNEHPFGRVGSRPPMASLASNNRAPPPSRGAGVAEQSLPHIYALPKVVSQNAVPRFHAAFPDHLTRGPSRR